MQRIQSHPTAFSKHKGRAAEYVNLGDLIVAAPGEDCDDHIREARSFVHPRRSGENAMSRGTQMVRNLMPGAAVKTWAGQVIADEKKIQSPVSVSSWLNVMPIKYPGRTSRMALAAM